MHAVKNVDGFVARDELIQPYRLFWLCTELTAGISVQWKVTGKSVPFELNKCLHSRPKLP